MSNRKTTKTQLLHELAWLRRRIADLERIDRDRKIAMDELTRTAFHDPITGLPNRTLFFDHLSQALALAKRNQHLTAAMFFSLNRFKLINDTLGNMCGDLLLKVVSERLRSSLRESDILARPGRDEFMILLPEIHLKTDATIIAERIFHSLTLPFVLENHELVVTGNIGVSFFPDDATTPETMIKNAYTAMHQAKEEGRNRYHVYKSLDSETAFDSMLLENSLRLALQKDEFHLNYQPQVSLGSGNIVGVEALLRWNHPTMGSVSPALFIPIAEQTGLIEPLGEWVLRTACQQNKALQEAGYHPMRVAVNLSPKQLHQKRLLRTVTSVLEETSLEPEFLEIEITEGALVSNVTSTATILTALTDMGTHVAIDDFGTGYSSLSYLSMFKLNSLKIDKSFIDAITTNHNNASISRAIIALAHSLELRVIAEGVETIEQLAFLDSLGCDEIQGYFFSRPLAAHDLEKFLLARDHLRGVSPHAQWDYETVFQGTWEKTGARTITRNKVAPEIEQQAGKAS